MFRKIKDFFLELSFINSNMRVLEEDIKNNNIQKYM